MPEQTNPAKSVKDLTIKARFPYDYGTNDVLFEEFGEYMKFWHDKLFHFKEEEFEAAVNSNSLTIGELKSGIYDIYNDITYNRVDKGKLIKDLGLKSITVNSQQLKFSQSIDSNERPSKYINCGGLITSMKFLPKAVAGMTYLAVSVLIGDNLLGNKELSIFYQNGGGNIKSALQIWQIEDSKTFTLLKLLDTSKFGALSDLNWVPIDSSYLGTLSGLFKDGKVHFLSMNEQAEFGILENTSISYQFKNGDKTPPITTYDFLSDNRIIVGTTDGYIGEFILPNYLESIPNQGEYDLETPSFIHNVSYSPISSLSVGNPVENKYIINVSSHGGTGITIDYDNFLSRRIINYSSLLPLKYHSGLQVFLASDSLDTVGFVFARHTHDKPTLILKTDGVITSTAITKFLNTPLVLIGNSFGEVFVVNIARRLLSSGKSTGKLLVPLKLWKIVYDGPDSVNVTEQFEKVPIEKTNNISASPNEVVISCMDWCDSIHNSSLYGVGTQGGLLILEKLDQ